MVQESPIAAVTFCYGKSAVSFVTSENIREKPKYSVGKEKTTKSPKLEAQKCQVKVAEKCAKFKTTCSESHSETNPIGILKKNKQP